MLNAILFDPSLQESFEENKDRRSGAGQQKRRDENESLEWKPGYGNVGKCDYKSTLKNYQ